VNLNLNQSQNQDELEVAFVVDMAPLMVALMMILMRKHLMMVLMSCH